MSDIFYNRTVTIFNAVSDNLLGGETWLPTVLYNCRVLEAKGANMVQSGLETADACKLFIKDVYTDKYYLPPIEWSKRTDKVDYFTLKGEKDFFVLGDVSSEVALDNFFNYMKSKYDGVYRITTVDRYELIPHFEVGGK